MMLWDQVIKVFHPDSKTEGKFKQHKPPEETQDMLEYLESVDYVPPSIPDLDSRTTLMWLEENDAVIKIIIKLTKNRLDISFCRSCHMHFFCYFLQYVH